ncbi:MAG: DNA ligase [Betaproteobacteria bacterium HGW-Betaproteobacteria-20]|jgi:DNA ligase-1|nr:MAG: DNA ligase [Betaproteobacteria bacterium HGW-Betaproteobacteria-20]
MNLIRRLFLIAVTSALFSTPSTAQNITEQNNAHKYDTKRNSSEVLLAQIYQRGIDVRKYLVSEKFDGVRAVWDGHTFHTRTGRAISAPKWFTQRLPVIPLDGELWLARGKFDTLSGAVRKIIPVDEEWRDISFLVFELPNASGTFQARANRITEIVKQANIPHLKAVTQFRVNDETALATRLKQVVAKGGEGLMLHRADAPYITGRSDVLLKLKMLYDAEATVVRHISGRGKYKDKLGALEVETPEGIRFKLGSGFSDVQREHPPKIGSLITYTYRDKTAKGRPKFASFLRVRNE